MWQTRRQLQNLETILHDVDSEDLVLEIRAAIHTFPDAVASCPRMVLDYIYREQLLDLYGNLSIALRLLLTLPVTVASGERSFSALKLIKTYLRSTMSQERLSGLALISIEHKVRRSLDLEDHVLFCFIFVFLCFGHYWCPHLSCIYIYCFSCFSSLPFYSGLYFYFSGPMGTL